MKNLILLQATGILGLDLMTMLGILLVQAIFMIIVLRIALVPLKNEITEIKEILKKTLDNKPENNG
jgi:hypothetical protein